MQTKDFIGLLSVKQSLILVDWIGIYLEKGRARKNIDEKYKGSRSLI